MSDQADGQFEQTQDTQQAPATEAQAPDPIMARLDELTAGLQELRQPQQQAPGLAEYAQQPYQQEPEADEPDDYGYDDSPDMALQQLEALITTQVDQRLQPMLAQQQQKEAHRAALDLEAKYPDLADRAKLGPIFESVQRQAQQIGNPDLAYNPAFIETVYLAERARTFAAQETPADGGTGVHLEGGAAQPQQPVVDERDRIVGLGQSNNTFGWT